MSQRPPHPANDEEADDSGAGNTLLITGGVFLFLAGAACGSMLYAFGLAGRRFDVTVLRGGLLTFGVIALAVALGVFVMTGVIQLLRTWCPQSLTFWKENQLLNRARRQTMKRLSRRRSLQEEQARLTARLQATYIMEKESARVANQQALQELRGALQSSMVRSCEIVFDHLNRTMEHYEELIAEIDASALPALQKKELMDALSAQLSTQPLESRRRSAQQMMEAAIWDVRFRKARLLASKKRETAVTYLQKIRGRTDSHKLRMQIDSLIREFASQEQSLPETKDR